ncbi:hypothetical protein [Pendulispora albinea]|uniref:CoF synthetase n=1 Tax=Pendulispora albinea TaxID=2741071 RepID=A0ABZ2M504_9BACT
MIDRGESEQHLQPLKTTPESTFAIFRDVRKARKEGPEGVSRRQRARLRELIAYVRAHSPYYRELYADLPASLDDVRPLPVTNKQKLSERFDDWVTDRELTLAKVRAHADDPDKVGQKLHGKYTVTTSSGTTGRRAFFLMSEETKTVGGLLVLRAMSSVLSTWKVLKILTASGRTAMLVPTGGHFGSHVLATQKRDASARRKRSMRIFPVTTPMPELVEQLTAFQPTYVECYPTVALLLTGEREAGRLAIAPEFLAICGEGLTENEYARMRAAFGTTVLDLYGANEFPGLMIKCPEGWYHLHDDWMIFEPVDAHYQPTPPGERSHTVLVTVLYRREQPILRYDIGDSILVRPDPCPCGNPFQAIKVNGRVPIMLHFPTPGGEVRTLSSFVVSLQIELAGGVELFQIVQTAPETLRVRLQPRAGADPEKVWRDAHLALSSMLTKHGLAHVAIERGTEPPELSPGGKLQSVIPLGR